MQTRALIETSEDMAASRFSLLNDADFNELEGASRNKNTDRTTQTWLAVFKLWAEARSESSDMLAYSQRLCPMHCINSSLFLSIFFIRTCIGDCSKRLAEPRAITIQPSGY